MEASRSCFYSYLKRRNTQVKDPYKVTVQDRIKAIFDHSKETYGSRRIVKKLQSEGYPTGRYRARSFMRKLGLKVKKTKRYKVTTDSRHCYPVDPNFLDRQFKADAPNTVWTADINYIWTLESWLYLAAAMDLSNRQIVGWAMNKGMKAQLVIDALAMAYWRRKSPPGLLHHPDRGSRYAWEKYQHQLDRYQIMASMSRKGNCWDDAPTERFFRSLKSERLAFCRFTSRNTAKAEVLDYITFYNADRLHSALGYISPMSYERINFLIAG